MRTARLRVLDPCAEDYDAMRGAGTTRFCDRCSKNVTNLSDMTRQEAHRFLEVHAGERVCVRYRSRAAEIQFRPSTAARLGFVAALSFALAACTGYLDADELDSPEDALVCHDAFGYAVPCEQVDDGVIPLDESTPPAGEEGGDEVVADVDPVPPHPPTTEIVETQTLGQVAIDPEVGCPVPAPDPTLAEEQVITTQGTAVREDMGVIEAPPASRREARQARREGRREARAERQLARRQR